MIKQTSDVRPFFKESKIPDVIAHRGGGGEWPQETIYALEHAFELGVDILELDVHRTADGTIVLMHNPKVDDTTDGEGYIKNLIYEDVMALDAAVQWPALQGKGIRVPTLEEVFVTFKDRNARMNIEIKQKEPSLISDFCDLILKHEMQEKVLVASGWNSVLREFRKELPEVATSASVLEVAELDALDKVFDWDYKPDTDAIQWRSKLIVPLITQKFVDKAHGLNLKLHAWTVNTPAEMSRMISLGVDGIITDFPSTLMRTLGRIK